MALELRKRLFARYYDRVTSGYEERMAEQKRALLAPLRGTVVEIGPGTGANLELLPEGVDWIGIEPNRHMHAALKARAESLGVSVDVQALSAGQLPLADESVDGALSTLVLCSVPDPARALAEIHRVLKPGGRFVFWEHVAAPRGTGLRTFQRALTPLWRLWADGCRLDRDTGEWIQSAGFSDVTLDSFRAPGEVCPRWVAPHVAGSAIR